MGLLFGGKGGDKGGSRPSKRDVEKWMRETAANDKKHGRDSKSNPNNRPNGKKW